MPYPTHDGTACNTWACCLNVSSGNRGCRTSFCCCHAGVGDTGYNSGGHTKTNCNFICCGFKSHTIPGTGAARGAKKTASVPATRPPAQQTMTHYEPPQQQVAVGYPAQQEAPASAPTKASDAQLYSSQPAAPSNAQSYSGSNQLYPSQGQSYADHSGQAGSVYPPPPTKSNYS